jgi:hypothetical protein
MSKKFAGTIFYTNYNISLTLWHIDVLISLLWISLIIKILNYVICFIVPQWWVTMPQMLGYSETYLFPNNYVMFIVWIRFCRIRRKDLELSEGSFSTENIMKF